MFKKTMTVVSAHAEPQTMRATVLGAEMDVTVNTLVVQLVPADGHMDGTIKLVLHTPDEIAEAERTFQSGTVVSVSFTAVAASLNKEM